MASTPLPLASMPIKPSGRELADQVQEAKKTLIPDNIFPHATIGTNSECAIRALAIVFAARDSHTCGFQQKLAEDAYYHELRSHFFSSEFRQNMEAQNAAAFAAVEKPGPLQHAMSIEEYKQHSDAIPYDDKNNLDKNQVQSLFAYYCALHNIEAHLMICEMETCKNGLSFKHIDVFPDLYDGVQIKELLVIRSVDANKDFGHFEGCMPIIPGFERDVSVSGACPQPEGVFLQFDPRFNEGVIPKSHDCTSMPCGWKQHEEEYHKFGIEALYRTPAEIQAAAESKKTDNSTTASTINAALLAKIGKSKSGSKQTGGKKSNHQVTLPPDIAALPDGDPEKLAALADLQFASTADAGKVEDDEEEEGEAEAELAVASEESKKAPEHFKTPPTHGEVTQNPNFYANAKLVALQTKDQDPAMYAAHKDEARGIAYIVDPKSNKIMPFQKDPTAGASVKPGTAQINGCFTDMGMGPRLKLSVTFARGNKLARSRTHQVEKMCQISWYLGKQGKVRVFNPNTKQSSLVECMQTNSFQVTWVPEVYDVKDKKKIIYPPYLEITFVSNKAICGNMNPDAITAVAPFSDAEQQVFDVFNRLARNPNQPLKLRLFPTAQDMKVYRGDPDKKPPFPLEMIIPRLPIATNQSGTIDEACKKLPFDPYRRNGDTVKAAFGNMKSRTTIIMDGGALMPMRPAVHFNDSDHAEIALSYGTHLEFTEEQIRLKAITAHDHVCTIHKVHEYTFVGITFSFKPNAGFGDETWSLPPNTKLDLKVKSTKSSSGSFSTSGITVDQDVDIHPIPNMLVLLTGKRAAVLDPIAQEGLHLDNPVSLPVYIQPDINETTVKAQIDAVVKAFDPTDQDGSGGQWHPLLEFDGLDMSKYDPFTEVSAENAEDVYQWLLGAVEWNDSQLEVIKGCRHMLHRCRLVTGSGGSGKTLLSVYIAHAALRLSPNVKVIYTSDRNSVCNNQLLRHVAASSEDDEKPVRVYPKHGGDIFGLEPSRQERDRTGISHETMVILELTDSKVDVRRSTKRGLMEYGVDARISEWIQSGRKIMGFIYRDGKVDETVHKDNNGIDLVNYLGEALTTLRQWRKDRAERSTSADSKTSDSQDSDPKKSDTKKGSKGNVNSAKTGRANRRAKNRAKHPKETQLDVDKSGQAETSVSGEKPKLDKDAEKGSSEATAEATEEGPFSLEDRARIGSAYDQIWARVIQEARVVVCTLVNCADKDFRQNFASGVDDKVFLEIDEGTTIHESSFLIPLAKCFQNFGHKIVSVGQYGDLKQLGPVVLGSNGRNGTAGFNEFGAQIRKSFFVRANEAGFPVYHLRRQGRMHEALFAPARTFFYEEDILSDGSNLDLPEGFVQMWRKMFGFKAEQRLLEVQQRMHFISNVGEHTRRSLDTGSRANMVNAETIVKICEEHIIPFFGKKTREKVCVIMGYQREKLLVKQMFQALRERKNLSAEEIPEDITIDSTIGREFDVCILDYVASDATNEGLGFMKDNRRMCVGHTRGRLALIILAGDMSPTETKEATASHNKETEKIGNEKKAEQSKPSGATVSTTKKNKKPPKTKESDGGTITLPRHAASYYQQYCAQNNARTVNKVTPASDCAWPIDFWDPDLLLALRRFREIFPNISVNRFGVPDLNAYQRVMVEEERSKIIKEMDEAEEAERIEAERIAKAAAAENLKGLGDGWGLGEDGKGGDEFTPDEGFQAVDGGFGGDGGWGGEGGDGWATPPGSPKQEPPASPKQEPPASPKQEPPASPANSNSSNGTNASNNTNNSAPSQHFSDAGQDDAAGNVF